MSKKEDLVESLRPIIHDSEKLKRFIVAHSNLPGPRGNLGLAFAFAEICEDFSVLQEWMNITEDQADGNDPESFPAFCSVVCLGKMYLKKKNRKIITILKNTANDGRWRMREAVAFAFQIIGEHDFRELKTVFTQWIETSDNLEKRAILASLAHPPFLDEENAGFCFKITDLVLKGMDRENNFDVLKKGLNYTISVFAAADPERGFDFIRRWIGKDALIDKIIKENLKKNRLVRKNPKEVGRLLKTL